MGELSPTVSVIVRTYDGRQELLSEALTSVAEQTYRPIEVVVVEDGSSACEDVVRRFREAVATELTIVYRSAPKRGRCHAGNVGLASATGDLVNFLDDDDQLHPHHLERLVPLLIADPAMPAAFGRSEVVSTTIRSLSPLEYVEEDRRDFRARAFNRWHLWYRNQLPIQACVFRRGLYEAHGGLDDRFELMEDWELWARYFSNAPQVGFVDEVTSMFRLPVGGLRGQRSRQHDEQIGRVVAHIRTIEVTVSAEEVRSISGPLLQDLFDESPGLSKALRLAGSTELRRHALLRPLGRLVAMVNRGRERKGRRESADRLSPEAMILLEEVRGGADGPAVRLTVGEAQTVLRELWRAEDPDRYGLLAVRNTWARLAPRVRRMRRLRS